MDASIPSKSEISTNTNLVLVPEGTFFTDKPHNQETQAEGLSIHVYLLQVHYGFVKSTDRKGSWSQSATVEVKYVNGRNLEVSVPIPSDISLDHNLAYILYFAPVQSNRGERFQTETRCINLKTQDPLQRPEASFVRLPIKNFAPNPWYDSLYSIKLGHYVFDQTDPNVGALQFQGKIKYIFYGYTEVSEEEYLKAPNKDVPWKNTFGEFKEEGIIDVTQLQHHPNGVTPMNKAYFVMHDLWIRVNTNAKLVWKIGFDTYTGRAWEPGTFNGYYETQTFYYKSH